MGDVGAGIEGRDPLLSVDGLTIEVSSHHERPSVVRDVSLVVETGAALGLVGESGSGKSLTLRAILGLLPTGTAIKGGRILYRGTRVLHEGEYTGAARALRGSEIAMVFQDATSALDPVLRVGDQIAESVRRHSRLNRKAARARTIELMQRMGIPHAERRVRQYPHEFSGGMRQRVMLAMAIACGPSLLLCDEPTTALDVTTQTEILALLGELRREERLAMLFVSHDLAVISETCDRVCVMYCGRLVETGSCADVFAHPRHPYTLGLLEAAPDIDSASPTLRPIPGEAPDPTEPPRGCYFRPRCPIAADECAAGTFSLLPQPGNRATACVRSELCDALSYAADAGVDGA